MKTIKRNVVRFLSDYGMDYRDVDMDANVKLFLEEMQRGLAGKKSSLEMIPTYISVEGDVPTHKKVIVADAGGTNFRVATVYFDHQKMPVIENLKLFKMPAVDREMGKTEFFRTMAGYFRDVIEVSSNIGFCFSYAVQMYPNKDGRLIRFSKEVRAEEVKGQLIGENLNQALDSLGMGGNKHIVLLNDTVVTLLAGMGYKNKVYSGYIGFILGTGTNTCYIEKNCNITKNKDLDPAKTQIINTESGGFARGHRGKLDIAFDKSTANPGVNPFEKMISGAYLGPLFGDIIRKACRDGLFSKAVASQLTALKDLSTKEMNEFMIYPYGSSRLAEICRRGGDADTLTMYLLADRTTERAAKFTAINLSSMAIKSGQGTDPSRPICIVAEGTTFYQMKTLKSRVEFYLKQYLENKKGIFTDIICVDNATLVGAAIAGLTN